MASHLRGIQGQCNIKKCVEPRQKSDKLTQWGWRGMTRTTEQKLFSNLRLRYLMRNTETQLPCPNFKTQSTDMPARCQRAYWPCIGRHIGRHVGRHLVRCWSTYWSTCWPTVDQYSDFVVTDTRLTYKISANSAISVSILDREVHKWHKILLMSGGGGRLPQHWGGKDCIGLSSCFH